MSEWPPYAEARRDEWNDLRLEVFEGALPSDLGGHFFFVGPVGNVGTDGFPGPSFNTALNGDGMIYRVDLDDHAAGPRVTTRLVRPADFYADEATAGDPRYLADAYFNAGILRLSLTLGARNFGNTAFVPFRFGGDKTRLLATFDGGRPLELDTQTLEVVTPMGSNHEWRAEAMGDHPFPPVLSTAHPAADAHTGELFCVNFGRSVGSIMSRSSLLFGMMVVPHLFSEPFSGPLRKLGVRSHALKAAQSVSSFVEERSWGLRRRLARFGNGEIPEDFLYLTRWNGSGALERWRVHDRESGHPVRVRQTMHQIAVTRRHVILMDTSMKITGDQAFNNPLPGFSWLERAMRAALSSPQLPFCTLWVVRRDDLAATPSAGARVYARRVELPLEAVHFVADYDDAGDRIRLQVQHDCTLDIAEWNRDFDLNYFSGGKPTSDVLGVPNVTAMDLNRVGRYVIDASRGVVIDHRVLADERCTWGLAVYAGADLATAAPPPERIGALFHTSPGFVPDLLTEWIYDLYALYRYRRAPLKIIDELGGNGRPGAIFRVDAERFEVDDILEMPERSIAGALQHAPSRPADPHATPGKGYLLCATIVDCRREIWVIDAGDLNRVVCRFGHKDLVYGTTVHAAWLPEIGPRTASYYVPPRSDYGPRIAGNKGLERLFDEHVYPHFPT
jgi:hypothetical protein